jgi:hypothetical protein
LFSAPFVQLGPGRKAEHGILQRRLSAQANRHRYGAGRGVRSRPKRTDGGRGRGIMSHIARVEVPGMFHLVEQPVRSELRLQSRLIERRLSAVMYRHYLGGQGVQLCGFNFLPSRTLLVLVPARRGAIGRAMYDADHMFAGLSRHIHHRSMRHWEGPYNCCPFSDEAAWSVLRYVDMASVRPSETWPFAPRAFSSAAEHASQTRWCLTAPLDRLPATERWRAWLKLPQDKKLVIALKQCLRTGKPFGAFPFVRKVEKACGRRLRSAGLNSVLFA